MKGSDLQHKIIRDEAGQTLGRLHELHIRDGVVTALICGPAGLLQRLAPTRAGLRIDWSLVKKITPREIVVVGRRSS